MDSARRLIWEAYVESWGDTTPKTQESYFDSWQLPAGCEDWRVKHKNVVGVIGYGPAEIRDLMVKGCKPMATLETDLHSAIISDLQQRGFYVEPVEKGKTFIGRDPEWVKKGIEAWRAQDHVQYGKALGYGEHSVNIRDPDFQARQVKWKKKRDDQEKAQYDYWNSLTGTGEDPPAL